MKIRRDGCRCPRPAALADLREAVLEPDIRRALWFGLGLREGAVDHQTRPLFRSKKGLLETLPSPETHVPNPILGRSLGPDPSNQTVGKVLDPKASANSRHVRPRRMAERRQHRPSRLVRAYKPSLHVWMRDGERLAGLQTSAEPGHDAAPAPKHVAETNGLDAGPDELTRVRRSAAAFVAPITLLGRTALSVDTSTNSVTAEWVRQACNQSAVARTLFWTAATGRFSRKGTCL